MRHLSRFEFEQRFPKREPLREIAGVQRTTVNVESDTLLSGTVLDDVVVAAGAQLTVTGRIAGSLCVEIGGVAYVNGEVGGSIDCAGAVSIDGRVGGKVRGQRDAAIFDPAMPADSLRL